MKTIENTRLKAWKNGKEGSCMRANERASEIERLNEKWKMAILCRHWPNPITHTKPRFVSAHRIHYKKCIWFYYPKLCGCCMHRNKKKCIQRWTHACECVCVCVCVWALLLLFFCTWWIHYKIIMSCLINGGKYPYAVCWFFLLFISCINKFSNIWCVSWRFDKPRKSIHSVLHTRWECAIDIKRVHEKRERKDLRW